MKILITGGVGFIGTNTALKAMEQGHEIIAFDNLSRLGTEFNLMELQKHKNFFFVRGDIRNTEDFKRIPEVDAIIALAANPGIPWSINWPRYDFEVNALGTLNTLEFARERGNIPVIFSSTNKVYSEEINEIPMKMGHTRYYWTDIPKYQGIPETYPIDSRGKYPKSPYGCSKYTGDMYCQEYYHIYGVPTVVNRQSCIAGKWQQGCEDQGWMAWFVFAKMFNSLITIYGNGFQVRDVLYADDLAQLYLLELENIDKCKGSVYNVGGGMKNTTSLIEAMEHIVALDGRNFNIIYKDWRLADQRIYISDISKVEGELGWRPTTSPIETIDHIWNWASSNRKNIWSVFKEIVRRR